MTGLSTPGAQLCPHCHTRLPLHESTCRRTVANRKEHHPMTDTIVIYGPGNWSLTAFASDPRTPKLLEWLHANGLTPAELPQEQVISIDTGEQGSVIRHVAYLTNPDGTQVRAGLSPVLEARTTPLKVNPPDELTRRPAPAGPDLAAPPECAVKDPTKWTLNRPDDCDHTITPANTYGDAAAGERGVCTGPGPGCGSHFVRAPGGEWQPADRAAINGQAAAT